MTTERPEAITMAPEAVQLALPLDREAPRASQGRRSIEADFPILEVSRLAQLESYTARTSTAWPTTSTNGGRGGWAACSAC